DGDPHPGCPALLAAVRSGGLAVRVSALGPGRRRDLPRGLRLRFARGLRPLPPGPGDPLACLSLVRHLQAASSRLVAQLRLAGEGVSLPASVPTGRGGGTLSADATS